MTSREARTQRRAAERKAKKAEMRRVKQAGIDLPELTLEEEFSPELMAEANAARQRVHRRALDPSRDRKGAYATLASPPQAEPPAAPSQRSRFVPQKPSRSEINRENAAHSTGPRSPEGKLASSRNSLQHGLASGQIIIPGEDPSQFEALLNDLLAEHQPSTTSEELLIREMAQSYWLTQRALRLQNECFNLDGVDEKRLSLFLRYQTTHERAFHKALTTLLKLQKQHARDLKKCGFVSHSAARPAPDTGFVSQNALNPAAVLSEQRSEGQFVRQNRCSEAA